MKRKTIMREIEFDGVGLHKGENIKMKLIPSENNGIVFKRVDLEEGKNIIYMDIDNTFDLTRGTNLKNEFGAAVHTIEHFLSALYIKGVTDLVVEINENEIPILDGSTIKFIDILDEVGVVELSEDVEEIIIEKPVYLVHNDKHIIGLPFDGYKITYTIDFNHSFLKSETLEVVVNEDTYKNEISRARTFCFDYEIDYLKKNNLALGGSLENAIVIKKDGVLNSDGLRYEKEFVRHKILDFIGDLKILNKPIKGHLIAMKSGHALDIEFAKLLKNMEENKC